MFYAVYSTETRRIRKVLEGPDLQWAQTNEIEAGEALFECAEPIDPETMMLDPGATALVAKAGIDREGVLHGIKSERDRRELTGRLFDGVHITGDDKMARNLSNLKDVAKDRLAAGDSTTTTFRDGSDVVHELTPAQLVSIWQQSVAYVSALYGAKWALEAMDPIPQDFAENLYWP